MDAPGAERRAAAGALWPLGRLRSGTPANARVWGSEWRDRLQRRVGAPARGPPGVDEANAGGPAAAGRVSHRHLRSDRRSYGGIRAVRAGTQSDLGIVVGRQPGMGTARDRRDLAVQIPPQRDIRPGARPNG